VAEGAALFGVGAAGIKRPAFPRTTGAGFSAGFAGSGFRGAGAGLALAAGAGAGVFLRVAALSGGGALGGAGLFEGLLFSTAAFSTARLNRRR
jgi:hypothetical protein